MSRMRVAPLMAVAFGLAAAWGVHDQQRQVRAQIGPQSAVVVALAPQRRGDRIDDTTANVAFERRMVPRNLIPDGALRDPLEMAGAVLAADVPAGTMLAQAHLVALGPGERTVRPGERRVTVPVEFVDGASPRPGDRVDVLASGESGGGFAELVLAGASVELAQDGGQAVDPEDAPTGGGSGGSVTLTVTLRQAARLLAARAGGATLGVVIRPPGDDESPGPILERLQAAGG